MTTKTNPLAVGIVGGKMVAYIAENAPEYGIPVYATCLDYPIINVNDADQVNYRLEFEDGTVSDWRVTFDFKSTDIVNMELFNVVIG